MDAPPYLHEMEQRLRQLERQNRALKAWVALAVVAALGAGGLAGYPLLEARGSGHARIRAADTKPARRSRRTRRPRPAAVTPTADEPAGSGAAGEFDEINDPFGTQQVDRARINEIIRAEQKSLLPCVSEETRRSPEFGGRFSVEFAIQPSGRVSGVKLSGARGAGAGLLSCTRTALARWRFPRFSGSALDVSVPLVVNR